MILKREEEVGGERGGGRGGETEKTLICCSTYIYDIHQLILVCALTGIEPEIFAYQNDALTNGATCLGLFPWHFQLLVHTAGILEGGASSSPVL